MPVVTAELSSSNTATQNGAAVQAAMTAAGSGGGVLFPSGTFDCLDGWIERGVTLSAPNTTLRHPDGTTAKHILSNQLVGTTANTTAGSADVTVSSSGWVSTYLAVGDMVAIAEAGVTYDATALAHISTVIAISGATVTLADVVPKSVTGKNITRGAGGWTIEGLTLDGNRGPTDSPNANVYPLYMLLCRLATVDSVTAHSGDHAGFFLLASWDNYLTDVEAYDCGQPASQLGGALWLFGDCRRNVVRRATITGDCFEGLVVDDRSTGVNEYDGAPNDNSFTECTVTIDARQYDTSAAVVIVGGNRTRLESSTISGADIGVAIAPGVQGTSRGNVGTQVVGNLITDCGEGVNAYLNNTKAVIDANEFTSCDTNITDTSGSSIIGTNTRAARLARQARIDGAWSPR